VLHRLRKRPALRRHHCARAFTFTIVRIPFRCLRVPLSPSELLASPSELLASPSELLASPSELLVSPSKLLPPALAPLPPSPPPPGQPLISLPPPTSARVCVVPCVPQCPLAPASPPPPPPTASQTAACVPPDQRGSRVRLTSRVAALVSEPKSSTPTRLDVSMIRLLRIGRLGRAPGDREWPLSDEQRPQYRGVPSVRATIVLEGLGGVQRRRAHLPSYCLVQQTNHVRR
jgi:hypothetical protein